MNEDKPIRVLIVDDSPEDLDYYSRLLSRADSGQSYVVLTAKNAEDGLNVYDGNDVDCSIVDFNLPDQDGLATVKALEERGGREAPPIVILTGEPTQEIQAKAARSGALDYVAKDAITSASQLERVIHKAISWSKTRS